MPGLASAGFPVLEGDYTTWTAKWKTAYDADEFDWNQIVRADESLDRLFIENRYNLRFTVRRLSDGSLVSVSSILDIVTYGVTPTMWSILRKYFATTVVEAGVPKLKIYKNGSLIQTIDLSQSPISWTDISAVYFVSFSPNGKYIFINNTAVDEYALFEGS